MRDIDIRNILVHTLRQKYGGDSDTLIIEEFGLCQGNARIDIAVINGAIYGFEIKSEKDTLRRLPGQKRIYNDVFDYITIVSSTNHLQNIIKQVPEWWGLHEVQSTSKNIKIVKRRVCKKNRKVNSQALVQLLWRDEVFDILKRRNIHHGLSGKPRRLLWARLAESLTLRELSTEIRSKIKMRQFWRSERKQELDDD
jgi:hypothetical protein